MRPKTFKKLILDEVKGSERPDLIKKIKSITSEKYSGGSSLRVRAIDLTKDERNFLEKIVNAYQHGSFDGMTDLYTFTGKEREQTVKYSFLEVEYSPENQELAKRVLKERYLVEDDESSMKRLGCWYDQALRRKLVDLETLIAEGSEL